MIVAALKKTSIASLLVFAAVVPPAIGAEPESALAPTAAVSSDLGIIKGIVKDQTGGPIADATVAIFRVGTSKLLKQVRSAADGSFVARIIPGTYTVLAVAEGFNPVTLASIEVGKASQLNYGFKLERAGSGNTLPEKRLDRNNPKWVIRAAQTSRTIFQNTEGKAPAGVADGVEITIDPQAVADESSDRPMQTVVESYFGGSGAGLNTGVNVATLIPINEKTELVLAGQTGVGKNAAQRFESQLKYRPNELHQLRVTGSFTNLETLGRRRREKSFPGRFQATMNGRSRGADPCIGVDTRGLLERVTIFRSVPAWLQFDIDPKTRSARHIRRIPKSGAGPGPSSLRTLRCCSASRLLSRISFYGGKPVMNQQPSFEFGIERVLDNRSTIEANVFFDTTLARGVGLSSIPFDSLDPAGFQEFTGNQQGGAQGLRLVYSRRLTGQFSAAAGYSFGVGQKLSAEGLSDPAELFQTDTFQSFFGQFEADLGTGTM